MKQELKAEMKDAMKAKDKPRLETIRGLLSAIQYEEMNKGVEDLPEATIVSVLQTEVKKRKESLDFAQQNDRTDMIESLNTEIAVIEKFLPSQLNQEELEKIVAGLIEGSPEANMGQIMGALKSEYAGQYDGKLASQVVKAALG
jgi:uncharacterized protein YqeY